MYTMFACLCYHYVINQIELRFVTDLNNFQIIRAIYKHLVCIEYTALANLTIQNTTNNKQAKASPK